MITVSKESLLYRFISTYESKWNIPNNLCALVRYFIKWLVLATIMYGLATWLAFGFVVSLGFMIFGNIEAWKGDWVGVMAYDGFMASLCIIVAIATACTAGGLKDKWYDYKRSKRSSSQEIVEKKPNLVMEYYRSIKGKYCPQIEFK